MSSYDSAISFWRQAMEMALQQSDKSELTRVSYTIGQYRSYLLESYFHTRENPVTQLTAAHAFNRGEHELLRKFALHAISEISHDGLALHDLQCLGFGSNEVRQCRPLPHTEALIAYTYYAAHSPEPLRYLGYLFHVEMLPTTEGSRYFSLLRESGIPEAALTFLSEHIHVDPQHTKLMRYYVDSLVKSSNDEERLLSSINTALHLHLSMISSALKREI